MLFTKNNVN